MRRLLIHPGFHKTGTTSIQKTLGRNRRKLAPQTEILLRPDLPSVCEWARAYSASRQAYDLLGFRHELTETLQRIADAPPRDTIISSEDLLGHMPGRRGLTGYDAAPDLMQALAECVAQVWRDPPQLIFYFSVRDAGPWLRSCHAQHLRTVKMELDAEAYATAYRDSARLGRIIDLVRVAVAPHRVAWGRLETCRDLPLGPLEPLLDLLGIAPETRARLKPLPPQNPALPEALRDAYLRINRSNLPRPEAQRAKKEALQRWLGSAARSKG
ncbi:hypothetical protein [Shimia sp.]|uniref:hypothetical protein n=1 Tax=Shimia sp. TaxID=1954381 RepID=UPI00356AEF41